MRRNAPPQRHPLVHISRGRDPEEAVQVRRRGALVRAQQPRRLLVRRAHVQLLATRGCTCRGDGGTSAGRARGLSLVIFVLSRVRVDDVEACNFVRLIIASARVQNCLVVLFG